MHSISIASADVRITPQKVSGEKVLVKALTALVNREGKKKKPLRRTNICLSESV
jgi:hypothetical protein